MYIVMGATGHVGSAVAHTLLGSGEPVGIVTRDAGGAQQWAAKGAQIIEADVDDAASLHAAFKRGRRAFLLNPPADVATDTDAVERRTVANILAALAVSGLEKVVAASTGGARPGERIGDLSVLWEFEERLRSQSIPAAINRAGYYMSNWDALLETARTSGTLPTMIPADMRVPMVAPADVGAFAARRLVSPLEDVGARSIEGPTRYTPADVAKAFGDALQRPVELDVTPRDSWKEAFQELGFSEAAADSYARMTAVSVEGAFEFEDEPVRGTTTLNAYVQDRIRSVRL